jgi:hypothetical protein
MRKKKKPPKRPRASKTEVAKRKNWFTLRSGRGLGTSQLIEMAMDEFDISERQAYRYYEMAMDEIDQKGSEDIDKLSGRLFNEIDFALQKAYTDKTPAEVAKLLEIRRKAIVDMSKRRPLHDTSNTAQLGITAQLEGFLRALESDGRTH